MDTDTDTTEREREREGAEMLYAGLVQAYAWAPREGATWLAARALLPWAELHLTRLGWRPREQRGALEDPAPSSERPS